MNLLKKSKKKKYLFRAGTLPRAGHAAGLRAHNAPLVAPPTAYVGRATAILFSRDSVRSSFLSGNSTNGGSRGQFKTTAASATALGRWMGKRRIAIKY